MKLNISIELNGSERHVGSIIGTGAYDARFCYSTDYIHDSDSIPVSVCLPLQAEPFSAEQTRNFFDGLLPEGYTRKTVANWLHEDEGSYIQILAALGKECLGALKVTDAESQEEVP